MIKIFNQRNIQISLTLYTLAALLTYGFFHVAAMFQRYSIEPWIGNFMASGLEIGVLGLSLAIGWRKVNKENKSTGYFWTVLVLCLFINILGNVSEGFFIKQGVELTIQNWRELDIIQIVIALAANLLIPFVTMAQSEILGDFIFQVFKAIVKKEKDIKRVEEAKDKITNIGKPEQKRQSEIFATIQSANGTVVLNKDLAKAHGVSTIRIAKDIKVLIENGKIKKIEGHRGYEVTK